LAIVGRSVSSLVNLEEATEIEILNTPVLSSRREDGEDAATDDEEENDDSEEDALEARLVEEMSAMKNSNTNSATAGKAEVAIYNKEAMLRLADEMDLQKSKNFSWVETLDTCKIPLELTNAHDDLKREVAFYNNTLLSVKHAKERLLKESTVPYKRPSDYFAEMLKTDAHMARVKDKLIYEQKKIAAVEERKKSQAHKKVAKVLQSQKAAQRLQEKNDTLEAVKQWKKRKHLDTSSSSSSMGGRNRRHAADDDEDGSFEKMLANASSNKRPKTTKSSPINHKRVAANKKWGSGGKTTKDMKRNDQKSTNDFSSFNRQKNNEHVGKRSFHAGKAGSKQKQQKKQQRPGKMARAKNHQKQRHRR
jgi:rRNA-processing protein EBP2